MVLGECHFEWGVSLLKVGMALKGWHGIMGPNKNDRGAKHVVLWGWVGDPLVVNKQVGVSLKVGVSLCRVQ